MSIYRNERKNHRNENHMLMKFSRWGGKDCYDAMMEDCSQNGICFTSEFPYLPGTEISIKLNKQDQESLVDVIWNRMLCDKITGKPSYKIGGKFIEPV